MFKKAIWTREEIPIGDYLMSFQDSLLADFMNGETSLAEAAIKRGKVTMDRPYHKNDINSYAGMVQTKDTEKKRFSPNVNSWRNISLKYTLVDNRHNMRYEVSEDSELANTLPTAYKIMKEFGDDCPIMNYSILAPQTAIFRHTGIENRDGRFIRIHIPLIVPEGDVFLEVNGTEIKWDDLFGFNNQFVHSAYNLTNEWRMVFLIDIDRERAGLSKGEPFNPSYIPRPFLRIRKISA